jgi:23S rRNA (uracil1939-C5)-methyltransferase
MWGRIPTRRFKRDLVEQVLRHGGIDAVVLPVIDARGNGRRRATLHATTSGAGYMRARSHELLSIATCPILVPALREGAPMIARAVGGLIGDSDVLCTATATGIDVAVKSDKRSLKPEKLIPLAQRFKLARLSYNGEIIVQAQPPTVAMGAPMWNCRRQLPAGDGGGRGRWRAGARGIGKAKSVADLFCGVGPFALRMAEQAKVFAYDSDKPGIMALQRAVRFTQGLKPVTAATRDLFRDPLAPVELDGSTPWCSIRRGPGAEAQARELAQLEGEDGGGGVVRPAQFYARCDHPPVRRLQARRGDAGRPVRLVAACGTGRGVPEVNATPSWFDSESGLPLRTHGDEP